MLGSGNTAFPELSGFLGHVFGGRPNFWGQILNFHQRGNWLMQMFQLGPKYHVYVVSNPTESCGPP